MARTCNTYRKTVLVILSATALAYVLTVVLHSVTSSGCNSSKAAGLASLEQQKTGAPLPSTIRHKPVVDPTQIQEEILADIEKSGPDVPVERKNIIVLITQVNSGSTFVAELLKRTPQSFIVHEPFWERPEAISINDSSFESSKHRLRDILDCSFSSYGSIFYQLRVWLVRSNNLRSFCSTWSLESCTQAPVLSGVCKKAHVIIVKIVRLRLRHLRQWMPSGVSLGPLKVMHLVRDPRGVLASRLAATSFYRNTTCKDENVLCEEMRSDVNEFDSLKEQFPGTTFQVRFEDILKNVTHGARVLYEALRLKYTEDVDSFLKTYTRASAEEELTSRLQRNSTAVAFRWRKTLPVRDILSVQESCKDVLKKLGYLQLKTLEDIVGPWPMLPRDIVN